MADSPEKSIEEILAACRQMDGRAKSSGGPLAAEPAAPQESDPAVPKPAAPKAAVPNPSAPKATPATGGKKPSDMSVADMLAAARAEKSGAGESAAGAEAPKAAAPKARESKAPAAGGKKAGEMSIAEIMAAARAGTAKAQDASGEAPAPKPKPAATPKPAAKAPAAEAVAAADAGPKDTSSVLAAARKSAKPGPLSKAEAAQTGKEPVSTKKSAPPMPDKPAYAQPRPAATAQPDRRSVLAATAAVIGSFFGSYLAVGFGSLATVSGLWGLGLARFMFPNILTEPPSRFKVGFPADFAPDMVATKFVAQFGVWVVNTEYEGQRIIAAIRTVCTHLGCTPNWLEGEQKFKCPCHGSGFYKDGINFEGPAPRPLERYAIRLADDGQLEVDKSKLFQQEMGQWADPACFVPV